MSGRVRSLGVLPSKGVVARVAVATPEIIPKQAPIQHPRPVNLPRHAAAPSKAQLSLHPGVRGKKDIGDIGGHYVSLVSRSAKRDGSLEDQGIVIGQVCEIR